MNAFIFIPFNMKKTLSNMDISFIAVMNITISTKLHVFTTESPDFVLKCISSIIVIFQNISISAEYQQNFWFLKVSSYLTFHFLRDNMGWSTTTRPNKSCENSESIGELRQNLLYDFMWFYENSVGVLLPISNHTVTFVDMILAFYAHWEIIWRENVA